MSRRKPSYLGCRAHPLPVGDRGGRHATWRTRPQVHDRGLAQRHTATVSTTELGVMIKSAPCARMVYNNPLSPLVDALRGGRG